MYQQWEPEQAKTLDKGKSFKIFAFKNGWNFSGAPEEESIRFIFTLTHSKSDISTHHEINGCPSFCITRNLLLSHPCIDVFYHAIHSRRLR